MFAFLDLNDWRWNALPFWPGGREIRSIKKFSQLENSLNKEIRSIRKFAQLGNSLN